MRMTLTMIEYDKDDKGKDDKVKNMIVHLASTFMLTAPPLPCHLLHEYTPSSLWSHDQWSSWSSLSYHPSKHSKFIKNSFRVSFIDLNQTTFCNLPFFIIWFVHCSMSPTTHPPTHKMDQKTPRALPSFVLWPMLDAMAHPRNTQNMNNFDRCAIKNKLQT